MFFFHVIFENTITGEDLLKEVIAKDHAEAIELACKDLPDNYAGGSIYLAGAVNQKTIGA